jgi:hypothetical protein
MSILLNNCQFGSDSLNRLDEADAFVVNAHPEYRLETRMEPRTFEPVYAFELLNQDLQGESND